jgi:hypothetical protein
MHVPKLILQKKAAPVLSLMPTDIYSVNLKMTTTNNCGGGFSRQEATEVAPTSKYFPSESNWLSTN